MPVLKFIACAVSITAVIYLVSLTFSVPSDVYIRQEKSLWFASGCIYTSMSFTEISCFSFQPGVFLCAPIKKLDISCVNIHEVKHRTTLLLAGIVGNPLKKTAKQPIWRTTKRQSQRCEKQISCERFQS